MPIKQFVNTVVMTFQKQIRYQQSFKANIIATYDSCDEKCFQGFDFELIEIDKELCYLNCRFSYFPKNCNNLKFAKFYLIRIHKRISIKIPFDKYIVQIYIQE